MKACARMCVYRGGGRSVCTCARVCVRVCECGRKIVLSASVGLRFYRNVMAFV